MGFKTAMTNINFNDFKNICQRRGLKVTAQRFAIYNALANSREHPSAEVLFSEVSKISPGLTLDTVYRTLNSLVDCGLAERISIGSRRARFDGNVKPHHHFVCETCGQVHDLAWPQFDSLPLPPELMEIGQAKKKTVIFRGYCHKCAKGQLGVPPWPGEMS